jgi:hypothetical protein
VLGINQTKRNNQERKKRRIYKIELRDEMKRYEKNL